MLVDWDRTYREMISFKGGYIKSPKDETYRGIIRDSWKHWKGWKIIDKYKFNGTTTNDALSAVLEKDTQMEKLVEEFYKTNYWDKIHGDELPSKLARKLFNTSIHLGPRLSVLLLQRALNTLNIYSRFDIKTKPFLDDLEESGIYDIDTYNAINSIFKEYGKLEGQEKIIDWYVEYQKEYYKAAVTRNPEQEKFVKDRLKKATYRGD